MQFITTCGPGLFLTGGSNNTQKTCDPCPAATFKATNGSEACQPCAAGSEVSEDKTECTPCQIETHYDDDKSSATVCAAAVANCQKGPHLGVTNRTTTNRCDPCPKDSTKISTLRPSSANSASTQLLQRPEQEIDRGTAELTQSARRHLPYRRRGRRNKMPMH